MSEDIISVQGKPLVISVTLSYPYEVTVDLGHDEYKDWVLELVRKEYPCGLIDTYARMESSNFVAPYQIISERAQRDFEYLRGFSNRASEGEDNE